MVERFACVLCAPGEEARPQPVDICLAHRPIGQTCGGLCGGRSCQPALQRPARLLDHFEPQNGLVKPKLEARKGLGKARKGSEGLGRADSCEEPDGLKPWPEIRDPSAPLGVPAAPME